ALRGRGSGRRRGLLRLRDELRYRGRDDLARLQLRPRAAPGRVPRAQAVEAALPRDLQARPAALEQVALQSVEPVPRFPRRESELSVHAVGEPDVQHLRLAEALLSAR